MSQIFTPVHADRSREKEKERGEKSKTGVPSARRRQWLTFSFLNPSPTRSLARTELKKNTQKDAAAIMWKC